MPALSSDFCTVQVLVSPTNLSTLLIVRCLHLGVLYCVDSAWIVTALSGEVTAIERCLLREVPLFK